MAEKLLPDHDSNHDLEKGHNTYYTRLTRRLVLLTVVCSLVPLLVAGWGINIYYARFAKSRMISSFRTELEHHRNIIELFIKERSSKLQLIAETHSKDFLTVPSNLNDIFKLINREYRSITDLGVIDSTGRHLAYVGPYDLLDKNYSETFWFKAVMNKGIYISDMFMGFRKEPHFVIAVTATHNNEKWILRATIDTEVFRSLVENVKIGETGEVFIVNQQGIYQTSPRYSGKILDSSPFPVDEFYDGIQTCIQESYTDSNSQKKIPRQIMSQAWLSEPCWKLVVKQNYAEAFSDVNLANYAVLIFLHLSAIIILVVVILITRHMICIIKKRDGEAENLNKQLVQTGKLAAIGQLSAGVAHEINNPLAIISTERQIMIDLEMQKPISDPDFKEQFCDSMAQIDIQIHRCKRITYNLLRFARRTQSVIESFDLNDFIQEVIELMEREAGSGGIKFFSHLEENLPALQSDPSQLQQVLLNIIINAIDACENTSFGTITIRTRSTKKKPGIIISIADTGSGISPDRMEKIFDPFFTTKPVGKGTGLGLSICFSTIKRLGGNITVKSTVGEGAEFEIFLPYSPPQKLLDDMKKPDRD
ncbi:MAG: GHKL domain-containing protein [Desulfobacterales bacterium]|nr:GHKL domain-containing protein [Desulfobacterales bacterium]